ncbi:MAG: DUF4868 domain-containing protein [Synergistaceae bacterium]|nr:DUF4868 domain-containing protein [Synergistaceae bacterium]
MSKNVREKMQDIRADIQRLSTCSIVQLYACIKDETISYKKIKLATETQKTLARQFTEILRKTYLPEKNEIIWVNDWFAGHGYEAKKLRKMFLMLDSADLHAAVNFSEITEDTWRFSNDETEKIHGLVIKYRIDKDEMWLYQRYSVNKTLAASKYLWLFDADGQDVYKEQKKPSLYVSTNIDVLCVNGVLLSDNIDVLEKDFGLNEYTRRKAQSVLDEKIKKMKMLVGEDGLAESISKGDLNLCRQIVKSEKSPVWKIKKEELVEKVRQIQAEKNLYADLLITEDNKFNISSYKAKRTFMKLVNDEILMSVLTGITYDVRGVKSEITE